MTSRCEHGTSIFSNIRKLTPPFHNISNNISSKATVIGRALRSTIQSKLVRPCQEDGTEDFATDMKVLLQSQPTIVVPRCSQAVRRALPSTAFHPTDEDHAKPCRRKISDNTTYRLATACMPFELYTTESSGTFREYRGKNAVPSVARSKYNA